MKHTTWPFSLMTMLVSVACTSMPSQPTGSPSSEGPSQIQADGVDLWTVNVDGTGLSQVTHQPAEYTGYRWLPSTG